MTETIRTEPERAGRLHAARARVMASREARDAELRRRSELPSSICRVCGGPIAAGDGDRAPEPEFATVRERDEHRGRLAMLPAEVDGWRRRCEGCADAAARGEAEAFAVSGILGTPVSQTDARDVVSALKHWTIDRQTGDRAALELLLPLAETTGRYGRAPWSHVTPEERQRVAEALREVIAERSPARSVAGACGLCGRATAVTWHESRMTWPNGAAAPVCDTCLPVYLRRSEPRDGDDLARVVVELVTGHPVSLGVNAPEGVRAYCESRQPDPQGTAEPWQYAAEAIAELRFQTWRRQSELAPPGAREDAEQWHRDYLAETAAERTHAAADRAAETAAHW